jgi:hypothetical protein
MATTLIRPIAVNVNSGDLTYSGSIDTAEITDATITVADMSPAALAGRNLYLAAYYQ